MVTITVAMQHRTPPRLPPDVRARQELRAALLAADLEPAPAADTLPPRWDVYIACSWKQRDRVRAMAMALREHGLRVYDFTDPACRMVPEIPPERFPDLFDPVRHEYREYLAVPEWRQAVECNRAALNRARSVILILPCGADSHADWAYAVGRGARSCIVGAPAGERTPSHLWADKLVSTDEDAVAWAIGADTLPPLGEMGGAGVELDADEQAMFAALDEVGL